MTLVALTLVQLNLWFLKLNRKPVKEITSFS